MKNYKFDCSVIPTIVGREICVFEFQILYKRFFRKKVIYSGSIIVNRNMETWGCGEFVKNPKADEYLTRVEHVSRSQAEFIFKAYDLETERKRKCMNAETAKN